MYRTNLIKYAIEIRRQHKTLKLNQLRSQLRYTQEIQYKIDKLLHISVNKQNYCVIQNILNQINYNIILLFSRITQPEDNIKMRQNHHHHHQQSQYSQCQYQPKHHQLLKSQQFKSYLLNVLDNMNWINNIKSFRKLSQHQSKLLNQLLTLIGLIMKQPQFLRSYFPLASCRQLCNKHQINGVEISQQENEDNLCELSFQLMQQILFYLKYEFSTVDSLLLQPNTFLTLIHSLTRIFQHFTLNSITRSSSKQNNNITVNNVDDLQSLNYLYQLLKSNTFQLYLKELMIDVIDSQGQNGTKTNALNKGSNEKLNNLFVIKVAILQLLGAYVNLVQTVNPHLQISKSLISTLLKFTSHCLKSIHHFNYQRYQQLFEVTNEQSVNYQTQFGLVNNQFTKSERLLCMRMLFSLHDIISHSQMQQSFHHQLSHCVCYEIMLFLHNNARDISSQSQSLKNQLLLQEKLKSVQQIDSALYYLQVLVCEQQNIWFTELQLIGCLYNIVSLYNVTLEQLFNFSIIQHQHAQPNSSSSSYTLLPILIDTKFILSLIQTLCQSIHRLSGTFFNQRHLFMATTVQLLCCWYENVENQSNNNKKKIHQLDKHKQFTIDYMLNLAQMLMNYLRQLKSDNITSKQIIEMPFSQHIDANLTSQIMLSQNTSILSTLTYLEEMLQEILQPLLGTRNDQIEI